PRMATASYTPQTSIIGFRSSRVRRPCRRWGARFSAGHGRRLRRPAVPCSYVRGLGGLTFRVFWPARAFPRCWARLKVLDAKHGGTMGFRVVCISRTTAAGGEDVGQAVAQQLGFRYVDEQIIRRAAQHAQVDPVLVAKSEHHQPLLQRLLEKIPR